MAKNYSSPLRYRVATYKSESPAMEGITWQQSAMTGDMRDLDTAKDVFDRASRMLQSADSRNVLRERQEERDALEALRHRGTSMRFETWERYEGDKRCWFGLALYVLIPRAA